MSTNKKIISLLIILVTLSGCNRNTTINENCKNATIIPISPQDFIKMKPDLLFKRFEFIPLETKPKSLIGEIKKIRISDSIIYILDETQKTLKKFSLKGNYLGQIGSVGRAIGEYSQATDFQILKNDNQILIWDNPQKKMNAYNMDGTFINDEYTNNYFLSFSKVNQDYWCYTAGINEEGSNKTGFNLTVYNDSLNSKGIKKYFPSNNFYPRVLNKTNFFRHKDVVTFHFGLCDTIYRIHESKIEPYIYIDAGKFTLPYEKVKEIKNMNDCGEFIKSKEYFGIISDYMESSLYIYFNIQKTKSGETINVIYDKKNDS
jgi:hypothetical protein